MGGSADFGGLWPWALLVVYGVAFVALAPRARDAGSFYEGKDDEGRAPTLAWLFGSLFITWIFAKSVTNAANLGARFGMPGAVAYAAYWLSIPVGGVVIVALRRRTGARSLSAWLTSRYGKAAAGAFLLAILIRLYNEVWSNTVVVGSYFGPKGSAGFYAAALVFTAVTLAYSWKGGLRSSIWTDALQAGLFAALLVAVVVVALPKAAGGDVGRVVTAGEWTMAGGLDLLLVALLQVFSYPFHDPVLTDRAFLSDGRTTIRAFVLAGVLGGVAIALFGAVGIPAFLTGTPIRDDAPRVVAASLGTGFLVTVTVVMLTSAGSTLDSTFSAVAKAVNVDAAGVAGRAPFGLTAGRIAMLAAALLGSIPLFAGARILQATTVSGTMVLGLAPIFVVGLFVKAPPASFHLAFWTGIAVGLAEVFGAVPEALRIGDGSYASLLGANLWGLAAATLLFLAPVGWRKLRVGDETGEGRRRRSAARVGGPEPGATGRRG